MISFNMLEAARQNAAKRYFYSSTACVYNEALQMDPENVGLTEDMVWLLRDLISCNQPVDPELFGARSSVC
jgi:nucleoside-diphosphate-sugar epimerase